MGGPSLWILREGPIDEFLPGPCHTVSSMELESHVDSGWKGGPRKTHGMTVHLI